MDKIAALVVGSYWIPTSKHRGPRARYRRILRVNGDRVWVVQGRADGNGEYVPSGWYDVTVFLEGHILAPDIDPANPDDGEGDQ